MNNTVILFGGNSGERLVSVASAQNLVENFQFDEIVFLDKDGSLYEVSKAGLKGHANPFMNEFKASTASLASSLYGALPFFNGKTIFLALHGTEGEDGKIQNLFERNAIFFTGSGSESSRNAFNKKISKEIVSKVKIRTTAEMIFSIANVDAEKEKLQSFLKEHSKIILKPVANGSSIGLHIVDSVASLQVALEKMRANDFGDYIVEKFIEGRELTVGIYQSSKGLIALPPSEVVVNQGRAFDYEGKYLGQGTTEITPAQLTPAETQQAQKMALDAHQALNCYGYSRTDLILTGDGPIYLETNTLPGLSRPSFMPQQLKAADLSFSDFIQRQITLGEARLK